MRTARAFHTAVQALRRNLLRAILTALGIIIGIAAVIVMVEIGQGSSSQIKQSIASMGANNILVHPGTAASGGVSYGAGTAITLTADDGEAILRECPAVQAVAPVVRARAQVIHGNRNWVPQYIQGTTPAFLQVRDWDDLVEGAMFTDRDVRSAAKVAVLGSTLVRELFGGHSPIGKEIRVQNVNLRVVGVLGSKGANMMGMDQDDILLAPWTTIKYRIANEEGAAAGSAPAASSSTSGSAAVSTSSLYPAAAVQLYPAVASNSIATSRRFADIDQLLITARSAEAIDEAVDQITLVLRDRHRLREGEPDDFNVRDMTEMTNVLTSTSSLMTRLLLVVACISLIVGGVGIMNIMLVSVTERTREIGLRMAVGARASDILRQFLIEAVVLCVSGGLLGILLGRGISLLVTAFLRWPTETSLPAVLGAFTVSVTVGLVFGYYPAWKASRLDPIEALRYE